MKNFLKKLWNLLAIDGLLHLETSFIIMISCSLLFNIGIGITVSVLAGLLKEVYDKIKKNCTKEMIVHDLICDGIGILLALILVMFV